MPTLRSARPKKGATVVADSACVAEAAGSIPSSRFYEFAVASSLHVSIASRAATIVFGADLSNRLSTYR
jgi:hypothetical protein